MLHPQEFEGSTALAKNKATAYDYNSYDSRS